MCLAARWSLCRGCRGNEPHRVFLKTLTQEAVKTRPPNFGMYGFSILRYGRQNTSDMSIQHRRLEQVEGGGRRGGERGGGGRTNYTIDFLCLVAALSGSYRTKVYSHPETCLCVCLCKRVFIILMFIQGAGIACWLERPTCDRKVASSNPDGSVTRIFFSRVNFVC